MGNIADLIAGLRKKLNETDTADINSLPFENNKIAAVMENFALAKNEVFTLFNVFRRMDRHGDGSVNLDTLYDLIGEELGIISPYLERFFVLIPKKQLDKAKFLEFAPVLCTFCLLTREQIINFVFNLLDTNMDGFISKKDMLKFVTSERLGRSLFPQNFVISIDSLELERPDKVSLQQFIMMEHDILFLIYPAVRLQENLRREFGGDEMWESIYKRLVKKEQDEEMKQKNQYYNDEQRKKRPKKFEQMKEEIQKIIADLEHKKKELKVREYRRRGSDSRVGRTLPKMIVPPERHTRSLILKKNEFKIADKKEYEHLDESEIKRRLRRRNSMSMEKIARSMTELEDKGKKLHVSTLKRLETKFYEEYENSQSPSPKGKKKGQIHKSTTVKQ